MVATALTIAAATLTIGCATGSPKPPAPISAQTTRPVEWRAASNAAPYDATGLKRLADSYSHVLAMCEARVRAAEGRARQAGLYPNPSLDLEHDEIDPGEDGVRGRSSAWIEQPLIVGGRRSAAVRAAEWEVEEARVECELVRRKLYLSIEEAFADLVTQRSQEILSRDLLSMAEADHALASGADVAADREAIRANVHVAALELDVTRFTAERIFALIRLRRLTGMAGLAPGDVEGEPIRSMPSGVLDFSTQEAIDRHPEVRLPEARVALARARAELARAGRTPDVSVRAGASYNERLDEGSLGVGISIPIPIFDRAQGLIAEADALVEAAGHEVDDARLLMGIDLTEASQRVTEYDTLAVEYTTRIAPMAREAHDRVARDYADGKATFLDVIDAQGELIDAERQALAYRLQLQLYVARLEYLRADAAGGNITE